MILEYEPPSGRHIGVILNTMEPDRSALDTAVRLASILGVELEGVFVEDINLVRMTGLPFLRELRPWSLSEEAFSAQRMESELRALAHRAQQTLAQAAGELGVNWSFRVWQGRMEAESLIASVEADVLSLTRSRALMPYRPRALPRSSMKSIHPPPLAINVLMRDSEQSARALSVACRLAEGVDARISIWLAADGIGDAAGLRDKVRVLLEAQHKQAHFIQLADNTVQAFSQAIKQSGGSVLIAEVEHPILKKGLSQCLEALSCPVLLVR